MNNSEIVKNLMYQLDVCTIGAYHLIINGNKYTTCILENIFDKAKSIDMCYLRSLSVRKEKAVAFIEIVCTEE